VRALALASLLLASCGYALAPRGAPLGTGSTKVYAAPFENRTGDGEAGAFVAAAIREELARRGVVGEESAKARIEGVVEGTAFVPASPTTWRLSMAVYGRLASDGRTVAEARVGREEEVVSGQDPLETEARRRLALRRAASAIARDLVERFEAP
jgi:hypothetical protein